MSLSLSLFLFRTERPQIFGIWLTFGEFLQLSRNVGKLNLRFFAPSALECVFLVSDNAKIQKSRRNSTAYVNSRVSLISEEVV